MKHPWRCLDCSVTTDLQSCPGCGSKRRIKNWESYKSVNFNGSLKPSYWTDHNKKYADKERPTHNLKKLRLEAGVLLQDLAEEIGVNRRTIQRIENGKQVFSTWIIQACAVELGCEIEDILRQT